MLSLIYTLKPGEGPSIDRLADSWRYRHDPLIDVWVSFTGTRDVQASDMPEIVTVPIQAEGRVAALEHLSADIVKVTMFQEEHKLDKWLSHATSRIKFIVEYDYKRRSGTLTYVLLDEPVRIR